MTWIKGGDGTPARPHTWLSADGRYEIEKHPFTNKYMLKDGALLVDVRPSLAVLQEQAAEREG